MPFLVAAAQAVSRSACERVAIRSEAYSGQATTIPNPNLVPAIHQKELSLDDLL
jgi:hypothetical protein